MYFSSQGAHFTLRQQADLSLALVLLHSCAHCQSKYIDIDKDPALPSPATYKGKLSAH